MRSRRGTFALRAHTETTLTASLESDQHAALLAHAPTNVASMAANNAGAIAAAGLNLTDPNIPNIVNNPDGVGVAGLTARFRATGVVGAALGPRSVGVFGRADSGIGVRGVGSSGGVQGESDSDGVFGASFGKNTAGVHGVAASATAVGVRAQAIGNAGVEAASDAGPAVRASSQQAEGVLAEAKVANAAGVRAFNNDVNGIGIDGSSEKGIAVRGVSTSGTALFADTFTGCAVDASTFSQTEPAVKAAAIGAIAVDAKSIAAKGVVALGKTGVSAASLSPLDANDPEVGAAVFGSTLGGHGVYGMTGSGSGVVGVGITAAGGWAGCFYENIYVSGTVYKHCCEFSIDHPLDPKRKVLNHASVESPEHKTFYDGSVKLNARGRATVRLPHWFSALNDVASLRYQLTPIGAPAPDLHVAQEVANGVFVIGGGQAGQVVCWQVTGIRRDAYARAHPVIVEQPKRDVRPSTPKPTDARIRALGKDLDKAARLFKREAEQRERAARARTLPGPLPPVPTSTVESDDGPVNRMIDDTLALARGLMGGEGKPKRRRRYLSHR